MDQVAQWVGAEWLQLAALKVWRSYFYVTGCTILSVEDYEQQGLLALAHIPADTPSRLLYTIVHRRMIDYAREMSFSTRKKLLHSSRMQSIEEPVGKPLTDVYKITLKDVIPAPENLRQYNQLEVSMMIETTDTLTEQERMCMRLYYVAGFKMIEVGFRSQLSVGRISQLCASGVRKLRDRCNARPTSSSHAASKKTTKKLLAVSSNTSSRRQLAQSVIGSVN